MIIPVGILPSIIIGDRVRDDAERHLTEMPRQNPSKGGDEQPLAELLCPFNMDAPKGCQEQEKEGRRLFTWG